MRIENGRLSTSESYDDLIHSSINANFQKSVDICLVEYLILSISLRQLRLRRHRDGLHGDRRRLRRMGALTRNYLINPSSISSSVKRSHITATQQIQGGRTRFELCGPIPLGHPVRTSSAFWRVPQCLLSM